MRIVRLRSGGWISLETRVDLFTISVEDQAFIVGLVGILNDYEKSNPVPEEPPR